MDTRTKTHLRVIGGLLALGALTAGGCDDPTAPANAEPIDDTFFQLALDPALGTTAPAWLGGAVEWEYIGQAVYVRPKDRDVVPAWTPRRALSDAVTDTATRLLGTTMEDAHGRLFRVKSVDERGLRAVAARYNARLLAEVGREPAAVDDEVESVDEFATGAASRELHGWSTGVDGAHLWDGENRLECVNLNPPQGKTVVYYGGDAGSDGGMCTGSLIDDNFVLTAAHCVTNSTGTAWTYAEDSNPNDGKTESYRGKVCTRGNRLNGAECANVTARWLNGDYTGDGDFGDDLVVMKIDRPLGQGNWFALSSASNSVIDDFAMYNIGYPGTTPGGADNWLGADCSFSVGEPVGGYKSDARAPCSAKMYWSSGDVSYTTTKVIGGRYDASSGHSGGPVYYYGSGTAHYQTAVHDGFTDGVFEDFNGGARIAYHRDWIISMLMN